MTIAMWSLEEGAALPEHDHPHEQVTIALERELELTISGKTEILRERALVMVPANVRHGGRALAPFRLLDVFHPVRTEFQIGIPSPRTAVTLLAASHFRFVVCKAGEGTL